MKKNKTQPRPKVTTHLAEVSQPFAGLIVREKEPENLEFPFSSLNSSITPNEQFFIRNHFPVPKLNPRDWRLRIEGLVIQTCEITYDELVKMPSRTVTMVLECAGNSRIFLSPKVGGLQWELGAVNTDGGKSWEKAKLLGAPIKYAWRLWEYHWRTPSNPGACTLMARAADARGRVQPMQRDPHRGTYVISHVQPIEVEVRKGRSESSTDSYHI